MRKGGKDGFERMRQTVRYEAARYMEVSGSQVIVWGMALLPERQLTNELPYYSYNNNDAQSML